MQEISCKLITAHTCHKPQVTQMLDYEKDTLDVQIQNKWRKEIKMVTSQYE